MSAKRKLQTLIEAARSAVTAIRIEAETGEECEESRSLERIAADLDKAIQEANK